MPDEIFVLAMFSISAVTALGFGIIRAINKHLDRKHGALAVPRRIQDDLDELRSHVETIPELRERCAELEERVDFAERLLTRGEGADDVARRAGS